MPSRILREGILDSRAVNALSPEAELFYWHLLLVVDDYGRYEADAELLSVKCFPRRWQTYDGHVTSRCLTDVSTVLTDDGRPLVTVYQVGSKKYLQVNNFNQRLRAKKSRCPSPDGHMTGICPPRARGRSSDTEADTEADTTAEDAADVQWMQQALADFMEGKWGTPDFEIAAAALKACNGADRKQISGELVRLHRTKKRPESSWAWFVTMLESIFAEVAS